MIGYWKFLDRVKNPSASSKTDSWQMNSLHIQQLLMISFIDHSTVKKEVWTTDIFLFLHYLQNSVTGNLAYITVRILLGSMDSYPQFLRLAFLVLIRVFSSEKIQCIPYFWRFTLRNKHFTQIIRLSFACYFDVIFAGKNWTSPPHICFLFVIEDPHPNEECLETVSALAMGLIFWASYQ